MDSLNTGVTREEIVRIITGFLLKYREEHNLATAYGEPLVGFADAEHPYILGLRDLVSGEHAVPCDVLDGARTVIVYFLPLQRWVADSNRTAGDTASSEWARAYEETNAMFPAINNHLIEYLAGKGYRAAVPQEAAVFDREKLISSWSFKHLAYAAGLGTFGLNQLLITRSGCCGRLNAIVTDLDVKPDDIVEGEYCLYKKNGKCGACVKRCPSGALTADGYNRHACYDICLKNAEIYQEFGSSYVDEEAGREQVTGSEVCGKCIAFAPCAFSSG